MIALALTALLGMGEWAPNRPIAILFMGNSHTSVNDVPGTVRSLLETNGRGLRVTFETLIGSDLNAIRQDPRSLKRIADRKWDFLVLQGASISSSHKYTYSQAGPIDLARAGLAAGAKVLLFAEWPRRGWKESGYILGIYGQTVGAAKGAEILPVPQAWDRALAKRPNLELWSSDGNHAAPAGSYLAACVIAQRIGGLGKTSYAPSGVHSSLAAWLRDAARSAKSN